MVWLSYWPWHCYWDFLGLNFILSEESVKKGFTVLIDNRKGTFDGDLNTLAANVTVCFAQNFAALFSCGWALSHYRSTR